MNERTAAKRYFGMHMEPGVAEYRDPTVNEGQPYRIFLNEQTIKEMDASFQGRPIVVLHVDDVPPSREEIKAMADGFVVRSFFNKADGKHWAEFIAVTDKAIEAIEQKKWKLSNAYFPKEFAGGGSWHGVEYLKEVRKGEYEHLAIVPNPRYEASVILTPEEFKTYNQDKELELSKLSNSKREGEPSMLNFFKKTKVDNSDFENTLVQLPKSKIEKTISQLVNEADEHEMHKNDDMADGDKHHVMLGEEKIKVNDLVNRYNKLMCDMEDLKKKHPESDEKKEDAAPASDEEAKKKALELAEHEDKEIAEKKEHSDDKKEEPAPEKKQNDNFKTLANAKDKAEAEALKNEIETSAEKVKRGKARYGSAN